MQADGWPFPGEGRPFTYGLNEQVSAETSRLQQALAANGVHAVQEGLEVEFCLSPTHAQNREIVHAREDHAHLTGLIRLTNPAGEVRESLQEKARAAEATIHTYSEEKEHLWEREKERRLRELRDAGAPAAQIGMLETRVTNARELVMFELLTEMPDALEIPEDFYDGANVLEVQFKKTKFKGRGADDTLNENRKKFFEKLYEKAERYGLAFEAGTAIHYSLSFEDEKGENILDPKHPEFPTKGKAIIEGIAAAVADGYPILQPPQPNPDIPDPKYDFLHLSTPVAVSLAREGFLRLADGRIEFRSQQEHSKQHFEMMRALLYAGANHGLAHAADEGLLRAEPVERLLVEGAQGNTIHHARQVLNGSSVTPVPEESSEGREVFRINAPFAHLRQFDTQILYELGMIDHGTYVQRMNVAESMGLGADAGKSLQRLFNELRLVRHDGEYALTVEGQSFPVRAPEPPGEPTIFDDIDEDFPVDDEGHETLDLLPPAQEAAHRIACGLSGIRIVPGLQLRPGHNLDPADRVPGSEHQSGLCNRHDCLTRAMDSPLFKEQFSEGFHGQLRGAVDRLRQAIFPAGPPGTAVDVHELDTLNLDLGLE